MACAQEHSSAVLNILSHYGHSTIVEQTLKKSSIIASVLSISNLLKPSLSISEFLSQRELQSSDSL